MKDPNFYTQKEHIIKPYKGKIYKIITNKTKLILERTIFPYIIQYQEYFILMSDKRHISVMVETSRNDSRLIRT